MTQAEVEGMIKSQQPDGWFGPVANKGGSRRARGKPDLWPNMIALNCLQSYYEFSGDKRVLDLMAKYFRWQLSVPDAEWVTSASSCAAWFRWGAG